MSRFFAASYESDDSSDEDLLLSSDEELLSSSASEAGSDSEDESIDNNDDNDDEDDDDDSIDWDDDDDDDSDSDSDDDFGSGKKRGPSYFLKSAGDSDSDSDSDEKVVLKSAHEKYLDEVEASVDQIENLTMVQDWVKVANENDKLAKLVSKHPQYHISVPRLYIKSLAVLEDAINDFQEQEKEEGNKKKLNASESKALNVTRQRTKKAIRENQEEYDKYRKDPEGYENGTDEAAAKAAAEKNQTKENTADAQIFSALRTVVETRDLISILKLLSCLWFNGNLR
ncbi:unnamed protein product [Ambrosiozyma monospora]|uniref:Unnamed protein product n=1 Tax=Ambrosiozyma monospora TaxID=43982 RepID=A0ACB5U2X7_AMBMO|nr:unnamed protein product [Ambrosiozyma monospora]